MDSVGAGAGGGIHPGAPIIWPTIKPTTESTTEAQNQSQTQSTQSKTAQSSMSSSASSITSTSTAAQSSTSTAQTAAASVTVARSLSSSDISSQLMSIGLADNAENRHFATKMLEHGMELSEENFQNLFKGIQNKGANQTTQTAAFAALTKGLAQSGAAVKALEQFFSGNNNFTQQLQQMQQNLTSTQQALQNSANLMDGGVAANLSALLSEFDNSVKKMLSKESNSGNNSSTIENLAEQPLNLSKTQASILQNMLNNAKNLSPEQQKVLQQLLSKNAMLSKEEMTALQEMLTKSQLSSEEQSTLKDLLAQMDLKQSMVPKGFLKDLNALKSLLVGLQQKLLQTTDPKQREQLLASLRSLEKTINDVVNNLTAQSLLSTASKYNDPLLPDKYFYWMIPNPFSEQEKNIEILVKRDSSKKEAPVNPEKTQIVLKVETEEFGDIAVIVEISGKEVWYLFNTENDDARRYIAANAAVLREQMSTLDFDVKAFNSQVKKIDINKLVNPTIDLDTMKRIRTEA